MNDHIARQLRGRAFPTAIGWYGIAYSNKAVSFIAGPQDGPEASYQKLRELVGDFITQEGPRDDIGLRAAESLIAYHKGELVTFDVPLDLSRLTPFTQDVLLATARIPYGEVRPYAWVAQESGHPKATRAVGNALHINPWAPIIPCHRVVASNNKLGGYAKGPDLKQWYLRLEGYLPN